MRRGAWVLALGLVGAGCEQPLPNATGFCAMDQDCAPGEDCVSGVCEARPDLVLDSGIGTLDAGALVAVDASDVGPDVGFADASLDAGASVDAEVPDRGLVDAGADGGVPEVGFADAAAADVGAPDAGFPDSGVAPDSGAWPDASLPLDAGPVARGIYQYRRVLVPGIASNQHLTRAAVSPDDATLVLATRYDDLFVVDRATEALRGAQSLPRAGSGRIQRIEDLWIGPGASDALVAVTVLEAGDIVEGRLYRLPLSGAAAPTALGSPIVRVAPQAIAADPVSGSLTLVGHRDINGGYWVTVHSLDPSTGATALLGQEFTSAGCQDGAVVADGLGGRGIAYACGINGGEVGVRDSTGVFSRGPNVGNTARIAARPQTDYALAVSWSGGRLVRFAQGQWMAGASALSVGNAAWNVEFSDDGARALVTGQFSGAAATVIEYRHDLFSQAALTDVSIAGFDAAPYLGRSGVVLEEAAWRPGGDCGYLVGGCDTLSCARGYLVEFRVSNGRTCP